MPTTPHRPSTVLPRARAVSVSLRALLLGCLVFASGACNSSGVQETSPEKKLELYRETALFHYENGDLDRAESQALKGLEIEREDRQLLLVVGWINLRRGTTTALFRAEGVFRQVLELAEDEDEEKDFRVLLGLAETRERQGVVFDESATNVAKGERQPEGGATPEAQASKLRAEAHGAWEDAAVYYMETLELRPENRKAINGLQRVRALQGRLEESLSWSERLLETTTTELAFWTAQLEREDLSAREEERLRKNERGTAKVIVDTHMFAATLLHRLSRTADAIKHIDRVLALQPSLAEAYSRRAQLLCAVGRLEEASVDIERYLRASDKPFEHPDVRAAFELRTQIEAERQRVASSPR